MISKDADFAANTRFSRWKPAAVLRISGDDSATFLQGQFSNDLRNVTAEGAVYGLWLNHKGRVIADSFVRSVSPHDFLVISYFCAASTITERLEAFVIADDVVIEDVTADWNAITVFGAVAGEVVKVMDPGAFSFVGRRTAESHREVFFPSGRWAAVASGLNGAFEIGADEVEKIRITEGIPAIPMDIGPGDLPNEGGLEAVAISYNKGCYLGQEVMARLKSMGQVRRQLLRVQGQGVTPVLPAALFQGERRIGELRTRVPRVDAFQGLALLSLLNLDKNAGLSFAPHAEAMVRIIDNG